MRPSGERPDFDGEYGGLGSVREARADVRQWMDGRTADVETSEQAVLIVSELASNALEASPDTTYYMHLGAVDAWTVLIAVRNRRVNDSSPPTGPSPLVGPTAPRGRGLAIVESLARRMFVHVTEDEVCVSATLRTSCA